MTLKLPWTRKSQKYLEYTKYLPRGPYIAPFRSTIIFKISYIL